MSTTGQQSGIARRLAAAFGCGIGGTAVLCWAADEQLPGFLASACWAATVSPVLVTSCRRGSEDLVVLAAVTAGLGVPWLICHHSGLTATVETLKCLWVVLAVLTTQVGTVRLARQCRITPTVAAGISVVVGVLWLTWPLWLTTAPPLVVKLHPLLAINGLLAADLGIWTECPAAYRVMTLGQDVPYSLPPSPYPCVLFHLATGVAAGGFSAMLPLIASRSTKQIEADAAAAKRA